MKQRDDLYKEILLTIPETAQLLRTDVQRVYKLVRAGKLKALKLGDMRIRRQEIDRFLKEGEGYDFKDPESVKTLNFMAI